MKGFKNMLCRYRFWATVLLFAIVFFSLGGCSGKQYVGVETGGIATPPELLVPPEDLPKRGPDNTNIKDVAPAWAEDRRIGGQAIEKLKDLQGFNRSVEEGRQKNKTTK